MIDTESMTGSLAIGTLVVGMIIAIIMLFRFLRKPANRHPMAGERERNMQEIYQEAEAPPKK